MDDYYFAYVVFNVIASMRNSGYEENNNPHIIFKNYQLTFSTFALWEKNSVRIKMSVDPLAKKITLALLLDEVKEKNPHTLIVIMEPFFGKKEEPELDAFFKERIGGYQAAAKKIAEEYGAVFVPLQDLFNEYAQKTDVFNVLWDGVHPTTCGHQLIARRWKECVAPILEKR
jgi:lysophospholipase L1-like esterase